MESVTNVYRLIYVQIFTAFKKPGGIHLLVSVRLSISPSSLLLTYGFILHSTDQPLLRIKGKNSILGSVHIPSFFFSVFIIHKLKFCVNVMIKAASYYSQSYNT